MTVLAAIDLGTNSTRLLVADVEDGLAALDRRMRITRLGQRVDSTGRLAPEALERTLATVREYVAAAREHGAEQLRVAATSAVRDASNRDELAAGVRSIAGVELEVLSGAEEARCTFAGATGAVDVPPPYVVLDIGGGSTEVVSGHAEPASMTSRQLGCVRLTERRMPSDPPTPAEVESARAVVEAELDAISEEVDISAGASLIGVAGTVTTLAALHLKLGRYDPAAIHGARIPLESATELCARLLARSAAARPRLGPISPGREDVIAAGALILTAFMRRFGYDVVVASEADILDGLVAGLAARRT